MQGERKGKAKRKDLQRRWTQLQNERASWMSHWQDIS